MEYRVGDKVLVAKAQNGIDEMQKLVGTVCTISQVYSGGYQLAECRIGYSWLESWLEPATEINIQENDWNLVLGERYA